MKLDDLTDGWYYSQERPHLFLKVKNKQLIAVINTPVSTSKPKETAPRNLLEAAANGNGRNSYVEILNCMAGRRPGERGSEYFRNYFEHETLLFIWPLQEEYEQELDTVTASLFDLV